MNKVFKKSLFAVIILHILSIQTAHSTEVIDLNYAEKNLNPNIIIHYFSKTMFGDEMGIKNSKDIFKLPQPIQYIILFQDRDLDLENKKQYTSIIRKTISKIENESGISFSDISNQKSTPDVTILISNKYRYKSLLEIFSKELDSNITVQNTLCFARLTVFSDETFGSIVVIPDNLSYDDFEHCIHEEFAQAIGPAADHDSLIYSIFNDNNKHNFLTFIDYCILRILYREEFYPKQPKENAISVITNLVKQYGWSICKDANRR